MIIDETLEGGLSDGSLTITLTTSNGTKSVTFGSGEPEDFTLSKDLNDALSIASMLKMAYEAGINGESLIINYDETEE